MGMIQIGMPMPDNCVECRFNDREFGYCNATPVYFCGRVNVFEEDGRREWCPLKAQEPHVITVKDFENNPNVDHDGCLPAWVEYRRDEDWGEYWEDQPDDWGICRENTIAHENMRYWTSRPTDEQREAIPWN